MNIGLEAKASILPPTPALFQPIRAESHRSRWVGYGGLWGLSLVGLALGTWGAWGAWCQPWWDMCYGQDPQGCKSLPTRTCQLGQACVFL